MHLESYLVKLRRELAIAAEAGGQEARDLAERLTAPLESSLRLALLEALSAAAEEITRELAPGSVDLRLRRGEPEFVVVPPPGEPPQEESTAAEPEILDAEPLAPHDAKDGAIARINLRLPEHLKTRAERAAERDGLSMNAWLVRTVTDALERAGHDQPPSRRTARGRRYTGWAR